MNVEWIPTDNYYRELNAILDKSARQQRYVELFIQPFSQLMSAMSWGGRYDDELAGARRWAWVLPDDLDTLPAAFMALQEADAWSIGEQALKQGVAAFEEQATQLGIDTVTGWLVVADPTQADPIMHGYTGATDWFQPRLIVQYDTPNDYNLTRLRGVVVPFTPTTSVADYIIAEGLAESFAAEQFGEDIVGYYVTDFREDEIDSARHIIGANLEKTGFDVIRSFIFGDTWASRLNLPTFGMPDYGGYAIGYQVVQAFLNETGRSVAEATMLPTADIVRESAYFE